MAFLVLMRISLHIQGSPTIRHTHAIPFRPWNCILIRSNRQTHCFVQLGESAYPNLDILGAKADATLLFKRAIYFRPRQSCEENIDILLQRHGRERLVAAALQRVGLVSMGCIQLEVNVWWHNLDHAHVLATSETKLHPQGGEGRDTRLGSAVGRMKG